MDGMLRMPVDAFIALLRKTASVRKGAEDPATRSSMLAGQRVMLNAYLSVLARMEVIGDYQTLTDAILECARALDVDKTNTIPN